MYEEALVALGLVTNLLAVVGGLWAFRKMRGRRAAEGYPVGWLRYWLGVVVLGASYVILVNPWARKHIPFYSPNPRIELLLSFIHVLLPALVWLLPIALVWVPITPVRKVQNTPK